MKHTRFIALLLSAVCLPAWATEVAGPDELNRRNQQISRHCTGIVQARLNYASLPSAERASRDRSHSALIEECYRRFAVSTSVTPR